MTSHRSLIAAIMTCLLVIAPPGATTRAATTGDVTISGTVTAKGRYVFQWINDTDCVVAFWDYDFTPDLTVTDASGRELASVALADHTGTVTVSMEGGTRHAESCAVPFSVTVPGSSSYRVVLDPYFRSDLLTAADSANPVNVSFERRATDPAPDVFHRPAGPLIGTNNVRIDGVLEITADTSDAAHLPYIEDPLFGCSGMNGYSDIVPGAQITVKDQAGQIIGLTNLAPLWDSVDAIDRGLNEGRCLFEFSVDLPDSPFYTFTLGRRGDISFSRDDLDKAGWNIGLSLGRP